MPTVIIVDDQPINRTVLRAMVEHLGGRVLEARDGDEGLRLLSSVRCDLLLFDIHMPRMSGLDMVRQMREGSGPNKETVSVAVTADATIPLDHIASCGGDGLLEKPITLAAVSKALATLRPGSGRVVRGPPSGG